MAFGVVKGGREWRTVDGAHKARSLDCVKYVMIHSKGETGLDSLIKLSKPTITMQDTDLKVEELFSYRTFS